MQCTKGKSGIGAAVVNKPLEKKARGNAVFAMMEMHLPMVRSIARKSYRSASENVDYEDLFSAGLIGLLGAIEDFDISVDGDFDSYCRERIAVAVTDCLRIVAWAKDEA